MSDTAAPTPDSGVLEGDVVVTPVAGSLNYYGVLQHPGPVQFTVYTWDHAIRLALRFAQRHAVNVWHDERGSGRLLYVFRPAAGSADSPSRQAPPPRRPHDDRRL